LLSRGDGKFCAEEKTAAAHKIKTANARVLKYLLNFIYLILQKNELIYISCRKSIFELSKRKNKIVGFSQWQKENFSDV